MTTPNSLFSGPVSRFDSAGAMDIFRRAVIQGRLTQGIPPSRANRFDSDSINLLRDFTARLGRVYEDIFADLRAEEFIPRAEVQVSTTSQAWLGEFLSRVGRAAVVTELSDDLPAIQLKGQSFNGRIATLGAAGLWTQEDIARQTDSMVNIPVATQTAARKAIETEIDDILTFGLPGGNVYGFARHPEVDSIPLPTGNWNARTYAEVIADFHAWLGTARARLAYVAGSVPDTLILPESIRGVLAGKLNTLQTESALDAITRVARTVYGVAIDFWYKLENASQSGGKRAILYRKSPEVLGSIIPLDYLQFNPQERGLIVQVPAIAKCGGVVVIQSKAIVYGDNL